MCEVQLVLASPSVLQLANFSLFRWRFNSIRIIAIDTLVFLSLRICPSQNLRLNRITERNLRETAMSRTVPEVTIPKFELSVTVPLVRLVCVCVCACERAILLLATAIDSVFFFFLIWFGTRGLCHPRSPIFTGCKVFVDVCTRTHDRSEIRTQDPSFWQRKTTYSSDQGATAIDNCRRIWREVKHALFSPVRP
jgi:hypothetical protein